MDTITLYKQIKSTIIERSVNSLSQMPVVNEDITGELTKFYDQLEMCIQYSDSTYINPVLISWASSQTLTDISGNPNNFTQTIHQLLSIFRSVSEEYLVKSDFFLLMEPVTIYFAYALEKASELQIIALRSSYEEQKNKMRQAMLRLEESKSTFISIAAHELRTPLTLIEGYTAMIQDMETKDYPSLDRNDLLNGILTGAARLRNIINDMIDISLIDNSILALNIQPVWFSTVFDALRFEFEKTLQERSQTLEINSSTAFTTKINADPDRLMQVFRNLINNAIKFTPDGGKISVDGRLLPGFTEITISDTGIGIDHEDQNHIFEKFGGLGNASLHSSGKSKFKGGGAGLGLSIARGIIEAHQGTIWVESSGKDEKNLPGSTFHVLIPQKHILNDAQDIQSKISNIQDI